MPRENEIDCPALHKRSNSYPFGDRVPRTVRMLKTVTADPMPGIGLAYIKGDAPVAKEGQTYPVWTNSHGAVTAVMEDGTRLGLRPAEFEVESWHHLAAEPAQQPHPEPIAWMVGTAIWWTKEEAERDAAETGLPIVGLGPMAGVAAAEQRSGDPVAWMAMTLKGSLAGTLGLARYDQRLNPDLYEGPFPVFRHADPAEVERLRIELDSMNETFGMQEDKIDTLRAQLAEAHALLHAVPAMPASVDRRPYDDADPGGYLEGDGDWCDNNRATVAWLIENHAAIRAALSASAEPSAPNGCAICRDLGNQCMECEEGEFREWADRHFAAADYRKTDAGVFIQDWMRHSYGAWCARGALTSKK